MREETCCIQAGTYTTAARSSANRDIASKSHDHQQG
jgi:hypothetical protein